MGLSIVAVTINCRDPRSLAEWWAETLDEGEITQDLGEYVFVHAGRVELGFQGVAAAARERIRLHLDLEADDPEAEVRRLVDRGAVVVEQHELAPRLARPKTAAGHSSPLCQVISDRLGWAAAQRLSPTSHVVESTIRLRARGCLTRAAGPTRNANGVGARSVHSAKRSKALR
jgi:hypothetical protein